MMKNRLFRVGCCCALAILFCTGCGIFSSREITVSKDESPGQQREYYRNELINHDGLTQETENFLRGNLLHDNFDEDPQTTLKEINKYYKISGDPKYLLIAADFCHYLAIKSGEENSIKYNLSTYHYSTAFCQVRRKDFKEQKVIFDIMLSPCIQIYNEACNGIFAYLKKRDLLDTSAVTLHDCEGRKFVLNKPEYFLSVPKDAIKRLDLCSSYTVKDLMQINRQPGIGVPLVATIKMEKWYSSLRTPPGITIPVTLLLMQKSRPSGEIDLQMVFVDTGKQESLTHDFGESLQFQLPMALDFSTPLACFLNSLTQRNLLAMMLNPIKQEQTDGLYMVEPYQPNKIPVVFIHGLMSSPETWCQMINSLKNDATIRSRYQFWFFSYSTGGPVILSAKKLQNALLAAQKEFCTTPEATENFNKMILVGHSMGGLLTRMMVQKEPHYVLETIFSTPWDQIKAKLQPEDLQYLEDMVMPSLPFVHRVVFMAVPHKGANMAQSPIAQLGISLIKLPQSLLSKETNFSRINRILCPERYGWGKQFFTGIDNLDPDNGFVKAIGSSALKADLTYHCVIGNAEMAGSPDGSDGVVPYWSSHLDNAASELVVKSDHSVHRRPAAIQELLRILLLHLKSVDAK